MPVHQFHVEMTCSGCSNAVTRVLKKNLGENAKFEIDLEGKTVDIDVESSVTQEQLMEYLKKTGKEVNYKGTK